MGWIRRYAVLELATNNNCTNVSLWRYLITRISRVYGEGLLYMEDRRVDCELLEARVWCRVFGMELDWAEADLLRSIVDLLSRYRRMSHVARVPACQQQAYGWCKRDEVE